MIRFVGWIALFILIAFICGLVASVPVNSFAQNSVFAPFAVVDGDSAKAAIEAQFGVTFPSTFSEFHRASKGTQASWIQFRLPGNSLGGVFRASSYLTCNFPLQDQYKPIFEFSRLLGGEDWVRMSWWNPDAARVYVGGECTGTDYKIFRSFADISNASQWVFYMEVVQT